jgi:hypothetical protein
MPTEGGTMDLSPEMSSYIKTGRCPHCNAVLLAEWYIAQMGGRLEQAAIGRAYYLSGQDPVLAVVDFVTRKSPAAYEKTLVGPERKARVIGSGECNV